MTETTILDERAVSEIEARAAKASKGPWESPANQQPWPDNAAHFEAIITADGGWIHRRNWKQACLNMDFISHAREDIPALCATVKHLRALAYVPKILPEDDEVVYRDQVERLLREKIDLQSQLERLRTELAEEKRLRSELKQIAQTGIAEVSSVGTALKDIALIDFRSRAVQLCKDKAAGYGRELCGDIGIVTAATYNAQKKTADELAAELEKL